MMRRQRQRGATLVVTLVILVVITIVGVAALRGSSLNLAIATNSQIRAATFQAAQEGIRLIERTTNQNMGQAMSANGIIMSAVNAPGSVQLHCLSRGSATGLRAGTCDIESATDYLTNRQATIVQASIVVPKGDNGQAKTYQMEGEGMGEQGSIKPWQVNMYSTAIMPALGAASSPDIKTCLAVSPDSGVGAPNMTQCLSNAGATFTTAAAEYCYGIGCYPAAN